MAIDCVVVDAGARYGLHPTWADLQNVAEFHLFEMDEIEAKRLKAKYADFQNIQVYPLALYREDTELVFRVSQHQALNSLFESNDELLRRNEYMLRDFEVSEERSVSAKKVDTLFDGKDVHFLKLDVEGAEYDLLQGATSTLEKSVLGVRSEVLFAPVYEGAALFGELNKFFIDRGFELLNLDYTGAGNKAGRFTLPDRYGKLMSSDAVWVVGSDRLFSAKGNQLVADVLRFSLFAMNNGATDLAVDCLLRAVSKEGVSFESVSNVPLVMALHKKVLFLFKSLLSLPMLEERDITDCYRAIFGQEFPIMNRFYETIDMLTAR